MKDKSSKEAKEAYTFIFTEVAQYSKDPGNH